MNYSCFSRSAAALGLCVLLLAGCQGGGQSSQSASSVSGSQSEASGAPNYSLGLTDDGLYQGYLSLEDYVTLPQNYNAIPSGPAFTTVEEEDLQAAIDRFMSSFSTDTQILDRPVEAGDLVSMDYVGTIDGVAFEGGDSQRTAPDYTAGSSQLIDDFLTQIIGVMPGQTVDVTVTFPDPYTNNPDLSGKQAVFATTIHYIHGESQVPELTEEFVRDYLSYYYGFTSVADMTTQLRAQLLAEQQYNYVLDWLYDNTTFAPVPEDLVEDQLSLLRLEVQTTANAYGLTPDELARQQYGVEDLEQLLENYRPGLENLIRQHLMCQALAQDAGITVDEQAVADYFAAQGLDSYNIYLENYGQGYLYQGVRTELVAQYLIDHVVE